MALDRKLESANRFLEGKEFGVSNVNGIPITHIIDQLLEAKECDVTYQKYWLLSDDCISMMNKDEKRIFARLGLELEAKFNKDPNSLNSFQFLFIYLMYFYGVGIKQNEALAFKYCNLAAQCIPANAIAIYDLACWFDGELGNIEKDHKKAFEYYQKAASLGYRSAIRVLGYMYSRGIGVVDDQKKALECYQKAAALNDTLAITNLGNMHLDGRGTPKDMIKGLECWTIAAVLGNETAITELATLKNNHQQHPICSYYLALIEGPYEPLQNLLTDHPDLFLDLILESQHSESNLNDQPLTLVSSDIPFTHDSVREIREKISNLFEKAYLYILEIVKNDERDLISVHRIRANVGIMAMARQDIRHETLQYFIGLNPTFLTPEENADIGLFIMSHIYLPHLDCAGPQGQRILNLFANKPETFLDNDSKNPSSANDKKTDNYFGFFNTDNINPVDSHAAHLTECLEELNMRFYPYKILIYQSVGALHISDVKDEKDGMNTAMINKLNFLKPIHYHLTVDQPRDEKYLQMLHRTLTDKMQSDEINSLSDKDKPVITALLINMTDVINTTLEKIKSSPITQNTRSAKAPSASTW